MSFCFIYFIILLATFHPLFSCSASPIYKNGEHSKDERTRYSIGSNPNLVEHMKRIPFECRNLFVIDNQFGKWTTKLGE